MSVIVTNARSRIAYNVVRSLGQRGIRVYAGDFVERSMSFVSRHCAGHFIYPSPFRKPEGFIDRLIEEIETVRAKVLIPVFEETFLVAKYKARLAARVSLAVPDYEQILLAHNKDQWATVAHSLGIPVPRSYTTDELRASPRHSDVRYPVLIKPKQGGGAWGIQEVSSAAQLDELLDQEGWAGRSWDRFFVQEKIAGDTHCVAMLFNRGLLRAKVGYRQLRDYPATGGQATMRISVRHDRAEACFQRLLEELRWHGPCQADFIVDRHGEPYLIDINPRLWGSLTQAIASGVDFPYLIYLLATRGDVPAVESFKTGVITRWIGGELAALPSRVRRSGRRLHVLREFFFPDKSAVLLDDFSVSDPLPFLIWTLDAAHRAVKFRSTHAVSHDSLDGVWE